jgi:hypothetical protein
MKRLSIGSLLFVLAFAAVATLGKTDTLSSEEIEALIIQATGKDFTARETSRKRLSRLHHDQEFLSLLILHRIKHGNSFVSRTIGGVFSEIGEPAVPLLFAKAVEYQAGNKKQFSSAGGILTHYIRYEAVPFLITKLEGGTLAEQKFASWALSSICRWRDPKVADPQRLAEALFKTVTTTTEPYVLEFSRMALCSLDTSQTVPFLVNLLSDPDHVKEACQGLSQMKSDTSGAIPQLRELIESGKYPNEVFKALAHAGGSDQVPFIIATIDHFSEDDFGARACIAQAIMKHPHPAAIPLMQEILSNPAYSASAKFVAGIFFSKLDHEAAISNLGKSLDLPYPEPSGEWKGQVAPHRDPIHSNPISRLRVIAIRSLAERGADAYYPRMLALLKSDPSINVRTAVVEAIAKKQVPAEGVTEALGQLLFVPGSAYTKWGYKDGSLPGATVAALSHIGTPEALQALYQGMLGSPAQKACFRYWMSAPERSDFEVFLKSYRESPVEPEYAARILTAQLKRHQSDYSVSQEEVLVKQKSFLKSVDPERFAKEVELNREGYFTLQRHLTFFSIEFALVDTIGGTAVYRETEKGWLPVQ